jgi:hypothetical protein
MEEKEMHTPLIWRRKRCTPPQYGGVRNARPLNMEEKEAQTLLWIRKR